MSTEPNDLSAQEQWLNAATVSAVLVLDDAQKTELPQGQLDRAIYAVTGAKAYQRSGLTSGYLLNDLCSTPRVTERPDSVEAQQDPYFALEAVTMVSSAS